LIVITTIGGVEHLEALTNLSCPIPNGIQ